MNFSKSTEIFLKIIFKERTKAVLLKLIDEQI